MSKLSAIFPTMPVNAKQTKAVLDAKVAEIKKQHSIYWIGESARELARTVEDNSFEYLRRLRAIQRGVANLVKITTQKEIPVKFSSGQQSMTDGKSVILSASIDPGKIDVLAGLALHEASHVAISNKSLAFLRDMFDPRSTIAADRFRNAISKTTIPKSSTRLGLSIVNVQEYVKAAMNLMEDRRIDLWQYKQAPGYRPYYDAVYNEYWHSDTISQALKSGKFTELTVENYMLYITNLTNENWKATDLPMLDKIRHIFNLTDEGLTARGDTDPKWDTWLRDSLTDLNSYPLLFRDGVRIVEVMLEHATSVDLAQTPDTSNGEGEGEGGAGDSDAPGNDLANYDSPTTDEVREAMERQQKFINHEIEKTQLNDALEHELNSMDQSKAQIRDVEGDFLPRNVKCRVMIYRDVTKKVVIDPLFPFGTRGTVSRSMSNAVARGVRMGQVLAKNLTIMADESTITYSHQEHGRLDKRRVAALGFGQEDVFSMTHTERRKPANIWLDIDFSGSMEGIKAENAMALAIAIAYAAEQTRTLNVMIAIRDGDTRGARIAILYDSRRHPFSQLRSVVPLLKVGGSTPESLCFEALKDEMMKAYPGERKFFINLSDGAPGSSFYYSGRSYSYGGDAAVAHCHRLMTEFADAGIGVLSYFIADAGGAGSDESTFRRMYGQSAKIINPSNVASIIKTVNELLLTDETAG